MHEPEFIRRDVITQNQYDYHQKHGPQDDVTTIQQWPELYSYCWRCGVEYHSGTAVG